MKTDKELLAEAADELEKTPAWLSIAEIEAALSKHPYLLVPTQVVAGRENRIHRMPPLADRWKKRSTTYQGIAEAMADQWTNS